MARAAVTGTNQQAMCRSFSALREGLCWTWGEQQSVKSHHGPAIRLDHDTSKFRFIAQRACLPHVFRTPTCGIMHKIVTHKWARAPAFTTITRPRRRCCTTRERVVVTLLSKHGFWVSGSPTYVLSLFVTGTTSPDGRLRAALPPCRLSFVSGKVDICTFIRSVSPSASTYLLSDMVAR